MACAVLKNVDINITDETTLAELVVHMTTLGITYTTLAFLLDGWCCHEQCVENRHDRQTAQTQELPAGPLDLLFREGGLR